jgi:prophage regulatory protein
MDTLTQIDVRLGRIEKLLFESKSIYSADEAAKYLGLAKSTLYKMTCAGSIKFSKPGGKKIYFAKVDLDTYLLSVSSASPEQLEASASTYESQRK